MYEIDKIYRRHVHHELALINEQYNLLNKEMVEAKILSFLSELGHVGEESQCYSFWDHSKHSVEDLTSAYMQGLHMLLSIGFELKVDHLKDVNELTNHQSLNKRFIDLYQTALKLNQTYQFTDFQDLVDDYLTLGFALDLDMHQLFETYCNQYEQKD